MSNPTGLAYAQKYLNEEALEFIKQYTKDIESKLKSRLGYVESEHKDEVMKGAQMAATIIQENMVDAIRVLISGKRHAEHRVEYHETERKQLARSLQYVMSSIEDEHD